MTLKKGVGQYPKLRGHDPLGVVETPGRCDLFLLVASGTKLQTQCERRTLTAARMSVSNGRARGSPIRKMK